MPTTASPPSRASSLLQDKPPPKRWAQLVLSLFVLWHAIALMIGPMPPSYLMAQVYPFFQPYLQALHLDNPWGFFAPDPTNGRVMRYRVETADGEMRAFLLTESLQRGQPAYLRFTTMSTALGADIPEALRSAAHRLCAQHTRLQAERIHFTLVQQLRITPEQFEAGHRPLDDDFVHLEALPPIACP